MDWQQIVWAILIGAMIVMVFPRVKRALDDSPEGSTSDWLSALIPIALVGGFIALLVVMV